MRKSRKDITEKGEITKRYLQQYPDTASQTIARAIRNDYPLVFSSINDARDTVRYYRGAKGKKSFNSLSDKTLVTNIKEKQDTIFLPTADVVDYEPVLLSVKEHKHILVLSDIHIPYHDETALSAAIEWGAEREVDTVLLNGDIIDNYQWSSFIRDPRMRSSDSEFQKLVEFLKYIDHKFPKSKKIWKEGNHEERFERYIKVNAPILWRCAAVSIPDVLSMYYGYDLKLHGWTWVSDKKTIKVGNLNIIHGHEIQGGGYANIARNLFLRTYDNTLKGHSHRKNDDIVKTIDGKFYGAWAIGCLCQLHAEWNPNNQWTHGFAYIKMQPDGNFMCANIQIINGVVL
jgi:predicted phosphodiesterase